ncbi:hypothetical protein [Actinoplanes sp. NBRC 101535]|uniref:hypothetical protein n=1 Tax=Actinoplanes sp. NBRC 101535 TaxID=3032196 RepID=UPI0024A2D598|nr:hypothetical protein [Actinoplanes sp. NBRC 101535]GLY04183.1 hypothetical protein Acsp01_45620 [Actinoplanes sp. NBRC 101535]
MPLPEKTFSGVRFAPALSAAAAVENNVRDQPASGRDVKHPPPPTTMPNMPPR